jgi:Xaa-Pro dipeptidase
MEDSMLAEVNLPRFSLAERDRRYRTVRDQMAARGLDCLVIPHNGGDWDNYQSDVRYLTGIGGHCTGAAAVFSIEGAPIAVIRDPQRLAWWKRAQNWVEDTRGKTGQWSEALVQAVRDLGHERGRIGVVGLQDVLRDPEGTVSYTEWVRTTGQLPEAKFEDATVMMQDVRMQKSPEEVAFVERAAEIADAASLALFETARAGVSEHEIYAAMVAAMIRHGGEIPTMGLFVAEPEPNQTYLMPTFRSLEPDDVILTEFDAKYGGYMAQGNETVCVGTPPAEYERLFDLSLECFHLAMETIKPGVPWADVARVVQDRVRRSDYETGFGIGHGMGLAEDGPMVRHDGSATPPIILEGQCFILKPGVRTRDGKRSNRAGNTIVVESHGARRLGKLELKMRRLQ